jgi:hypothetical protein
MNKLLIAAVLMAAMVPSAGADTIEKQGKKLDQQLKKITLTASDPDGRRVVNRVMAEQLGVSRTQLVRERKQTGFVYGQIFGAHEVAKLTNRKFDDVAAEMKSGHSLLDISQSKSLDLKPILGDAKKLNKSIDTELDKVADGDEDEQADDQADNYDPSDDSTPGDTSGFSPSDLAQANNQVHQRGFAAPAGQGNARSAFGSTTAGSAGMTRAASGGHRH